MSGMELTAMLAEMRSSGLTKQVILPMFSNDVEKTELGLINKTGLNKYRSIQNQTTLYVLLIKTCLLYIKYFVFHNAGNYFHWI